MLRRRVWAILAPVHVGAGCMWRRRWRRRRRTAAAARSDLVVGISWNNYAQPRWAKADGPAIIEAVEAAGGTVIETDANDSSEQQLADVDSLIAQGADVLILLAKDAEAILPAVTEGDGAGHPGDRLRPAHRGRERVLHHVQQRAGRDDHGGGDHRGGARGQLRDRQGTLGRPERRLPSRRDDAGPRRVPGDRHRLRGLQRRLGHGERARHDGGLPGREQQRDRRGHLRERQHGDRCRRRAGRGGSGGNRAGHRSGRGRPRPEPCRARYPVGVGVEGRVRARTDRG